jgi:hypothetical protein
LACAFDLPSNFTRFVFFEFLDLRGAPPRIKGCAFHAIECK